MKREFSAGGVVFKKQDGHTLWLIRRPSPNPEYRGNLGWSFPKGWVDAKEDLQEAAIREVREEGGVVAKIIKKLPPLKVFFKDKGELVMKFITYFVMEYESNAPGGHDWETAETKWATIDEAIELLVHNNERELLKEALQIPHP